MVLRKCPGLEDRSLDSTFSFFSEPQFPHLCNGVKNNPIEPSYIVGGSVNWSSTMKNSMELPLKTKNRASIWPCNPTPGHESESKVTQLCLTLCDPMDCSLPSSSIHGIFQARVLEWVAISFFICPEKNMIWKDTCTPVHCSTVYNSRDMGAT